MTNKKTHQEQENNESDVSISVPWIKVVAGVVVIVLGLGIVFMLFYKNGQLPENISYQMDNLLSRTSQSTESIEPESIFGPNLGSLFAQPNNIKIQSPSVNIDINLVEVSVEEDGALGTPENWNEGGWYIKSAKPGEEGNIIISAHYDTNYGAPAAFWQLKNVKVNDRVYLVDELGKYYAYEVSDLFYVDIQDPDRLKIFEEVDDMSELTLITCGGIYLTGEGYNKRLVVKASLIDE